MKKLFQAIVTAELRFIAFIVIIFMSTQLISFSNYQLSNHYDIEYADFYVSQNTDYESLINSIKNDVSSRGFDAHVKAVANKDDRTIGFEITPTQDSQINRNITEYINSAGKKFKGLSRKKMRLSYQYERMYGGGIIFGYLIALILLAFFWWFKERENETKLRQIGWVGFGNIVLLSLVFIVIHKVAILVLSIAADSFGYQVPDYFERLQQDYTSSPVLFLVLVLVLAPLLEEILFRGLMYRVFLNYGYPVIGAIVVSGMFTLIHGSYSFASQEFKFHDPIYAAEAFIGSLGLCWTFKKYNTLLAPIVLHLLINIIAFTALIIEI